MVIKVKNCNLKKTREVNEPIFSLQFQSWGSWGTHPVDQPYPPLCELYFCVKLGLSTSVRALLGFCSFTYQKMWSYSNYFIIYPSNSSNIYCHAKLHFSCLFLLHNLEWWQWQTWKSAYWHLVASFLVASVDCCLESSIRNKKSKKLSE